MKKVYIIRHCEAEGQSPDAQLTNKGFQQALALSEFFKDRNIGRIISSPYKRAVQSIQPLAKRLNIRVEIDRNLTERVLSTQNLPDWFEKLGATFDDMELKLEGGESSQEATDRITAVVEGVLNCNTESAIIVTHGNIMALLLKYYNNEFTFDDWKNLSNPDVFLLKFKNNNVTYERLWK